ncbi:MAG: sigma-70 family RNA polymerase sigma factor [Gaiellaceae bacterium]
MATLSRTPDAELLLRLRSREREAWEELYATYAPRLRSFGYRLAGNPHDADDLVQETFVRAVPRLDRLDPGTADVGAYLFTTLRNLFLKQVERTKRQQPVAEVPEPMLPTPIEDDPERGTLLRRQQDDVRLANARLQPRQRLVLALRELEDRSYAEIGELVGMKENAVAQLIFRARESLRTELRLAEVDPDRLPEACRRYLPLLAAHLDGQLKPPRLEETLAHLEGCEVCQAALESMREASRRYRSLVLPALLETDEARAAIERRLDQCSYWVRQTSRWRRLGAVPVVLAAGLAVGGGGAALGVVLGDDGGGGTPKPAAVATATSGASTVDATPAPFQPPPPTTEAATVVAATTGRTTTAATTGRTATAATTARTTTAAVTTTQARATPVLAPTPTVAPRTKPPTPEPEPSATVTTPPADTTPPSVRITARPGATVATDSARIAFTAGEPATFSCRLDGAAFAACTSPVEVSGLGDGAHVFVVRARDAAGNVGRPVSVAWAFVRPDTTPPTVAIASGPGATTTETSAAFALVASEVGVTFECSLDGGGYAPCATPAAYHSLAVGAHTFAVRGRDVAGNLGQPATVSWTIATPLPDLAIGAFERNSIVVVNRGTAPATPSVLTITLVGTFSVPALAPGAAVTFSWSTCRVGTYSAIADRTGVVAESDESNNTAARRNTCA